MAQSNLSGPLNIDGALVVGGTAHFTGAVTFVDPSNVVNATADLVIGNFTALGTAGVHEALTVHSLLDQGALTALGTVGMAATQVDSLVDLGALTALGTAGLPATTVFGALNVIGTAGVHAAVSVHSLASEGAITATTISGTDLSMIGTAGIHGAVTVHSLTSEGNATLSGTALTIGTQVWSYAATTPVAGGVIGNVCWSTAPAAAGPIGWVCTAPGTWKAFGAIAA